MFEDFGGLGGGLVGGLGDLGADICLTVYVCQSNRTHCFNGRTVNLILKPPKINCLGIERIWNTFETMSSITPTGIHRKTYLFGRFGRSGRSGSLGGLGGSKDH